MFDIKKIAFIVLSFLFFQSAWCESLFDYEFSGQKISDILLVLGAESGVSVVADETVDGTGSFYFSRKSAGSALDAFLDSFSLFGVKEKDILLVSRILCERNGNKISLKAEKTSLEHIFKRIRREFSVTVLHDELPDERISIDVSGCSVEKALEICMKKFPEYEIECDGHGVFYVRKRSENRGSSYGRFDVTEKNSLFSVTAGKARLSDVLKKIFELSNREYSFFFKNEQEIENVNFHDKNFDEILTLVLEQGKCDYIERNGIFYVVELPEKSIKGKLRELDCIDLKWISVQDALSVIPQEFTSAQIVKCDKNTGRIFLTGSREENLSVRKIIEKIDSRTPDFEYKRIEARYLDAKKILSLIPQNMIQIKPEEIDGSNSILISGNKENVAELEKFINEIDRPESLYPVNLKFIKNDELLKNLPPSVSKESIIDSGHPNLIFFKGHCDKLDSFRKELELVDRPKPQIKYQLLVVQYSKSNSSSFKASAGISKTEDDESTVVSGELSNILAMNFDVISSFGYQFAASLNAQISSNEANIFTDTTLTGISGQEIKFQNTDTYRYIEYEYDKNSTATKGITQQITSGLIVGLNGWISGDDMITMNVNATVSKQNNSGSSETGSSLPSTSERIVTTQVRTKSGTPVIISGLVKDDESKNESRLPFLSRIPGLGELFKQKSRGKEKTEIVIYIVPHLVKENIESETWTLEKLYKKFVENEKI